MQKKEEETNKQIINKQTQKEKQKMEEHFRRFFFFSSFLIFSLLYVRLAVCKQFVRTDIIYIYIYMYVGEHWSIVTFHLVHSFSLLSFFHSSLPSQYEVEKGKGKEAEAYTTHIWDGMGSCEKEEEEKKDDERHDGLHREQYSLTKLEKVIHHFPIPIP
eukprot:gene10297-7199_t